MSAVRRALEDHTIWQYTKWPEMRQKIDAGKVDKRSFPLPWLDIFGRLKARGELAAAQDPHDEVGPTGLEPMTSTV